jgi:hypothetical protein
MKDVSPMADKNLLILFYRLPPPPEGPEDVSSPETGRVKTRIAVETGARDAEELYWAMLADLAENLSDFRDILLPTADGPVTSAGVRKTGSPPRGEAPWTPAGFQRGTDLGERMENAFRDAFDGGSERAVLIGSDVPHIDPAMVAQSFADLERHDMVLGPAVDGGYYLIGLTESAFLRQTGAPRREDRKDDPAEPGNGVLFSRIPWGTEIVRAVTLERAREAGLSVSRLPLLRDLDTVEDVRRVVEEHGERLPRLSAAFAAVCTEEG